MIQGAMRQGPTFVVVILLAVSAGTACTDDPSSASGSKDYPRECDTKFIGVSSGDHGLGPRYETPNDALEATRSAIKELGWKMDVDETTVFIHHNGRLKGKSYLRRDARGWALAGGHTCGAR